MQKMLVKIELGGMKMKEKIYEIKEIIMDDKPFSKRELLFGVVAVFLFGLVLGGMCSPKKQITLGSNNGSNNAGFLEEDEDLEIGRAHV